MENILKYHWKPRWELLAEKHFLNDNRSFLFNYLFNKTKMWLIYFHLMFMVVLKEWVVITNTEVPHRIANDFSVSDVDAIDCLHEAYCVHM